MTWKHTITEQLMVATRIWNTIGGTARRQLYFPFCVCVCGQVLKCLNEQTETEAPPLM
jgi:hypothetical protein